MQGRVGLCWVEEKFKLSRNERIENGTGFVRYLVSLEAGGVCQEYVPLSHYFSEIYFREYIGIRGGCSVVAHDVREG